MTENLPSTGGRDRVWVDRQFGNFILLSEADYALLKSLWPCCSVCDKPVAQFTYQIDPNSPLRMLFTAHCHGDHETANLTMKDIKALLAGGVQGGEAFTGRLLEKS